MLIDQFNRLMDEQRYAEAQVVAKRAAELDPNNPVVMQVLWQAKFVNRLMLTKAIQSEKEDKISSMPWTTWTKPPRPSTTSKPLPIPQRQGMEGHHRTGEEIRRRPRPAAHGAGNRDREEAPHAGLAAVHQ